VLPGFRRREETHARPQHCSPTEHRLRRTDILCYNHSSLLDGTHCSKARLICPSECASFTMTELHNDNNLMTLPKDASDEDRQVRRHSKDSSAVYAKTDHMDPAQKVRVPSVSSSAPISASSVSAVIGPPPPPEDKKLSRWQRWRRDRREARELNMPSLESSRQWKVGNVVS